MCVAVEKRVHRCSTSLTDKRWWILLININIFLKTNTYRILPRRMLLRCLMITSNEARCYTVTVLLVSNSFPLEMDWVSVYQSLKLSFSKLKHANHMMMHVYWSSRRESHLIYRSEVSKDERAYVIEPKFLPVTDDLHSDVADSTKNHRKPWKKIQKKHEIFPKVVVEKKPRSSPNDISKMVRARRRQVRNA